jgi:alkylated DNA nucleotide flippase Atl1
MKAQETTFKELVQGEKQFQVPLYQRTYSWTDLQLKRLWEDIRKQAELTASDGEHSTHFIGSIVLAPHNLMPAGIQRWVVVDGQQRLTTLMLAMCAIRDHQAQSDAKQRDRFNELYLTNRWQRPGDGYLRLMPTKADRQAFLSCIESTPEAGGADNIGAAYRFFRQRLAAADDPEDLFEVGDIERVISDRLALVGITADPDDNVHRIFESLNNTGLNLSQADLVRNLLFMLLPTKADVVYESHWLPMQDRLTPEQLEDLLYVYLVLHGQERVRRDGIYQGMERLLQAGGVGEQAVEDVVRDLARRSLHLRRIAVPQHEPDPRLRAAFRRLQAWGAQVAYPVLMSLLDRQERGGLQANDIVTCVAYIESFLVRRMIYAVPTNNLNRIFNALVAQLPQGVPVPDGVRHVLSRERSFWPDDDDVRKAFASRPFYWQGRPPQRQLVLRRLEESYPSAERVDFEQSQLTVEHVMPQTPTPEWLQLLAEQAGPEETSEDVHRRFLHTLGNLTLTAYNVELSNSPFQRKQDLLKKSNLELNKRIAGTDRWGVPEILARADELADRAVVIWPPPVAGARDVTGRDWSLLHRALAALPTGSWTTYGDLATLMGSHPVPVGHHLASVKVPNAHRALRNDGTISPGFRWVDPSETRDVADILREEGVRFGADGVAAPEQRLTSRDLADLLEMDFDASEQALSWDEDPHALREGHRRFITQVDDRQGPEVAAAAQRLLDDWRRIGGSLWFGTGAEQSCFLMWKPGGPLPWPCALYPSGRFEIQFKTMSRRAPFDDLSLRDEFRRRLNQAVGVEIPEVKLALYPSFPLRTLVQPERYSAVFAALQWFVAEVEK